MEKPIVLKANLAACAMGASAPAIAGLSALVVAACGGIASGIA